MKKENKETVETFNKRLEELFAQTCKWLEEEDVKFTKVEKEITQTELKNQTYTTKRLDVFTKDGETIFSLIPHGVWIIGAEGRVKLEGSFGFESLVYLVESEPSFLSKIKTISKGDIYKRKLTDSQQVGWHWVDEQIIGKDPLFTKDVFLALLERIN